MGRPAPLAEDLRIHIGPPLQVTFPKLLESDDAALAAQALSHYRERYSGPGKFENELIPGIVEAVRMIAAKGYFLAVATSKLESYSIEIVDHFGLAQYFEAVHGSRLDGGNANKADLIRHIIETEGLDPTPNSDDRRPAARCRRRRSKWRQNDRRSVGFWRSGRTGRRRRRTDCRETPGALPELVEELSGALTPLELGRFRHAHRPPHRLVERRQKP